MPAHDLERRSADLQRLAGRRRARGRSPPRGTRFSGGAPGEAHPGWRGSGDSMAGAPARWSSSLGGGKRCLLGRGAGRAGPRHRARATPRRRSRARRRRALTRASGADGRPSGCATGARRACRQEISPGASEPRRAAARPARPASGRSTKAPGARLGARACAERLLGARGVAARGGLLEDDLGGSGTSNTMSPRSALASVSRRDAHGASRPKMAPARALDPSPKWPTCRPRLPTALRSVAPVAVALARDERRRWGRRNALRRSKRSAAGAGARRRGSCRRRCSRPRPRLGPGSNRQNRTSG